MTQIYFNNCSSLELIHFSKKSLIQKPCSSFSSPSVSLHVQRQVIRPGECSVTEMTLERFHSRVFPVMSRQLVGSGKLPLTAEPGTLVRFLARVSPLVSLEVGTLGVDLKCTKC